MDTPTEKPRAPTYQEHHHNGHTFRCPCGVLHHWTHDDRHTDHFERLCSCGLIHWKQRKSFDGTGPDWAPPLPPLPAEMSPEEVKVLRWAISGKKRRLLGPLYQIGKTLERRGYIYVVSASHYGVTDAGKTAYDNLGGE